MTAARESGTATRRAGILAAARRVFLRESYAGASMESIAQEAGVSKQTVYNHFGSKEELFQALVRGRCQSLCNALENDARYEDGDPEQVLSAFGDNILAVMLAEESLDLYRLLQAEGRNHPELAQEFYAMGPDRTARLLTEYLTEQARAGVLDVDAPRVAAEQFVTMLMGHLRVRSLLGLAPAPDAAERRRYVESAVRIFLGGIRRR